MNLNPKEQLRIRGRMLDMIADKVRELYPDDADGSETFLSVITGYRAYVQRRVEGRLSTAHDENGMRECMRVAGDLMAELVSDYPCEMAGWSYGSRALNLQQHIYGVLCDATIDFSYGLVSLQAGAEYARVQ